MSDFELVFDDEKTAPQENAEFSLEFDDNQPDFTKVKRDAIENAKDPINVLTMVAKNILGIASSSSLSDVGEGIGNVAYNVVGGAVKNADTIGEYAKELPKTLVATGVKIGETAKNIKNVLGEKAEISDLYEFQNDKKSDILPEAAKGFASEIAVTTPKMISDMAYWVGSNMKDPTGKKSNALSDAFLGISESMRNISEYMGEVDLLKSKATALPDGSLSYGQIGSVLGHGIGQGASMAVMGRTLGPKAAYGFYALAGGADVYKQSYEKEGDVGKANTLASINAASTYMIDRWFDPLPENIATGARMTAKQVAKEVAKSAIKEPLAEGTQQIFAENLVRKIGLDAEQDLFESVAESMIGALGGAAAMGGGAVASAYSAERHYQEAKKKAVELGANEGEVEQYKRATLAKLQQHPEAFDTVFQQNVQKTIQEIDTFVKENGNPEEVRKAMQTKADLEEVYNRVYEQIKTKDNDEVASAQAKVVQGVALWGAQELGISPLEYFEQRFPRIERTAYRDFAHKINEAKRAGQKVEINLYEALKNPDLLRGHRKRDTRASLTKFLQSRGGLVDAGGELKGMDANKQVRGLINNKNGNNLDDAALAAWEAGYFPQNSERPSINEFLEAIDEELRGNKRFASEAEENLQNQVNELAEELDRADIDWRNMEPKEIEMAVDAYLERQKAYRESMEEEDSGDNDLAWFQRQLPDRYGINEYLKDDNIYDNVVSRHQKLGLIENAPEKFTGTTREDIRKHLKANENGVAKIKSPIEEIKIQEMHLDHLLEDNESQRKTFLNYVIATIERPNLIVKNGKKNHYFKLFIDNSKVKPHLQIVKVVDDGSFYVTNYRPSKSQLAKTIKEGQVVYDLSDIRIEDVSSTANNNITPNQENVNRAFYQGGEVAVIGEIDTSGFKNEKFDYPKGWGAKDKLKAFAEDLAKDLQKAGGFGKYSVMQSNKSNATYIRLVKDDRDFSPSISIRLANHAPIHHASIATFYYDFNKTIKENVEDLNALVKGKKYGEVTNGKQQEQMIEKVYGPEDNDLWGIRFSFEGLEDIYFQSAFHGTPHPELEGGSDGADMLYRDPKGAFSQRINHRALISMFERADASTFMHETAHFFFEELKAFAKTSKKSAEMLDTINKWLGYDGVAYTEAQIEQFARGFEQYLREGKAPSNYLKRVFDAFLSWMRNLYKTARELDVQLNDDVRAVYANILGGTELDKYMDATPAEVLGNSKKYWKAKREAMDEIYAQNNQAKKAERRLSGKVGQSVQKVYDGMRDYLSDAIVPLEEEIKQISPDLYNMNRRLEISKLQKTSAYYRRIKGFVDGMNKMIEADFHTFDLALKNRDVDTVQRLLAKYDLEQGFYEVRKILDDLREQMIDVGVDVAYMPDYFPRKIKDADGLLDYVEQEFGDREEYSIIQKMLEEKRKDGRIRTKEDEAQIVNSLIRGYAGGISIAKIGNVKERSIDVVDQYMNKFYKVSTDALVDYISGAVQMIENKKYFGRETKELQNLRRMVANRETTIAEYEQMEPQEAKWKEIKTRNYKIGAVEAQIRNTYDNDVKAELTDRKTRLEAEVEYLKDRRAEQVKDIAITRMKVELAQVKKDVDALADSKIENSVGNLLLELAEQGKISHTQELRLKELLLARFSNKGLGNEFLRIIRDGGYIWTLGNFESAITQFGDLGTSAYKNGLWNTAFEYIKAWSGKSEITIEDLGLGKIIQDGGYADTSAWSQALDKVLKYTGFEKMDKIAKQTQVNAAIRKARQQAKDESPELEEYLRHEFGEKWVDVKEDLKTGAVTDEILEYAMFQLLDVQPITIDQMPRYYAEGGKKRLFYMMKSYFIKQLNEYRKVCFETAKNNPRKAVVDMVRLTAYLMLFNAGADLLKDLLFGRPINVADTLVDNIFIGGSINRYQAMSVKREGLFRTLQKQLLFPVMMDEVIVDVLSDKEIKDWNTWKNIPLVGRPYYWWFGGGHLKTEKEIKKQRNQRRKQRQRKRRED